MNYKKIISMALVITMSFFITSSTLSKSNENTEFIRFHVIANSDSHEDQAIKLRVRDRLLDEFGMKLGEIHLIEDSRRMISQNIRTIEDIAQQEVDKYGEGYNVKAMLGHYDFPTRIYGSMVLAAGNYEALRVVIGKGKGANWWCVMFPPLCFVDITNGVAKDLDDVEDSLQPIDASLDHRDNAKVEYRFKILEWWTDAKDFLTAGL